jgi:site-specific recombinase XerD
LEDVIPTTKTPQKLPIVLSPEEVLRFLSYVRNIKHRTILTLCYAAGLRVSEAICLKVTDIDSQRMVIRVEQGKGRIDRYVSCWRSCATGGEWIGRRDGSLLAIKSATTSAGPATKETAPGYL